MEYADKLLCIGSDLFGDGLFKHVGIYCGIEFNIDIPMNSELLVSDEFFFIGFIFALLVLEEDFHATQIDVASVVDDRFLVIDFFY